MNTDNKDLYAGVLLLSRKDVKSLKITDAYSLHRVVFDLFEDIRNDQQKHASTPSGILYADKGGDFNSRKILFMADRLPNPSPASGTVNTRRIPEHFLQHQRYAFEVTINPTKRDKQTGKLVAVCERQAIIDWFIGRAAASWGFRVNPENLQIEKLGVQRFKKDGKTVTHGSATFKGELFVTDHNQFMNSFRLGIGRGRAFGFGLLQIVPL